MDELYYNGQKVKSIVGYITRNAVRCAVIVLLGGAIRTVPLTEIQFA